MAGHHRPMTSKQAKASFKKRGGMSAPPSTAAKRKMDRQAELDRRAEAIRQKEERAKRNAAERKKKEAKQREQRIAQGLAPEPEPKVAASQPRIKGFFANYDMFAKKHEKKEAEEREAWEAEKREMEEQRELRWEKSELQKEVDRLQQWPDESDEEMAVEDEMEMDEDAPETEVQPAQQALQKFLRSPESRKRRHSESFAPPSTQPTRRPGDVTDPWVQTNVKELYYPPSQNTIRAKRPKSANDTRGGGGYSRLERDIEEWKDELKRKQMELAEKQRRARAALSSQFKTPRRSSHQRQSSRVSPPRRSPELRVLHQSPSRVPTAPGPRSEAVAASTIHLGQQDEVDAEDMFDGFDDFPNDSQVDLDVSAVPYHHEESRSAKTSRTDSFHITASPVLSLRMAKRPQVTQAPEAINPPEGHLSDDDLARLLPSDSQVFLEDAEDSNQTQAEAEDVTALSFPSDSQIFVGEGAVVMEPDQVAAENFAMSVPNDSQALGDTATPKAPRPAEQETPLPQLESASASKGLSPQQVEELLAGITSSQFAELGEDLDEGQQPATNQVQTPKPSRSRVGSEQMTLAPRENEGFDLIPSSELAALDAVLPRQPNVAADATEPAQVTDVLDEFSLSQELDLDPDEAAALEAAAAAQTTPAQQAASAASQFGHEAKEANTQSGSSDYGEFDFCSQDWRDLAV